MLRVFRLDLLESDRFVVTLELVPGSESRGLAVDNVLKMAADAYEDGRISAVSMTDNPGGNPSLSPDALGHEIFRTGMDVIVHFSCRDMNRLAVESRALQLARMGIKNILALTGDYTGKGFGGQGAPVFDLDSVNLICALSVINLRLEETGDPEGFLTGCAVSPFKATEGETFAQYAKLCKKVSAGAHYAITQLGYDVRKFQELLQVQRDFGIEIPTLASVYVLTPGAARIMHSGKVPGAVVTGELVERIEKEWTDRDAGRKAAIERSARLAVILKGLGYRGIHIGGVHKSFETVAGILDRMEEIQHQWRDFVPEFSFPQERGFYLYAGDPATGLSRNTHNKRSRKASVKERVLYRLLKVAHELFFAFESPLAPLAARICSWLDKRRSGRLLMHLMEDLPKKVLLSCRKCGDCAIQHVAFLCPESQCPKHIRNGACGGSHQGMCEVRTDRACVWFRAYNRLAADKRSEQLAAGCVPPRLWELDRTSSWLNFHLRRDHQSRSTEISRFCGVPSCRIPPNM